MNAIMKVSTVLHRIAHMYEEYAKMVYVNPLNH